MTEPLMFLQGLGLSLLLGALVGIEREKDHYDEKGRHQFGLRTMSLTAMLGYVSYMLFSLNTPIFAVFTSGFFLLLLASYWKTASKNVNTGVTTEMAAIFVFIIGILMGMDQLLMAASTTLVVLLLLYFKESLHHFAHKVSKQEFYAGVKFLAIVFVILPLLPNEIMGPLEVLNPYVIWFVVVLISSISFLSYIAIKWLGPRNGIGFGGFLGGLVSSTAVSMSFSDLSKKNKKIVNPFVFGILLASTAMFFRVLLEVFALNKELLPYLLVPMGSMGAAGLLICLILWFSAKNDKKPKFTEKDLKLKSPFQLKPAIQFGLLFAALLLISKYATQTFGDQGLYITAFLSGVMDVDAITVSMANLHKAGEISANSASIAVTIAAMTNTLSKGLIVLSFGSKRVGRRVLFGMTLILVIGAASLFTFTV
ncbi:MAG: uncharacterized membrane protein (DUF4010 family) [Oceanicoccus sp.]|jgi:uncharacterized membrane protein (DUF4010 family)